MSAFPVSGVNCYWLSYCSSAARIPLLASVRAMGGTVVRAWGFPDGAPGWPERLDATIADAEQAGIRLILPVINHWPDFGGLGAPAEEFYRDAEPRREYRERVERLLTRMNSATGRAYAEEPAILAWELANEPRADRATLVEWADEMAAHVKAIDAGHLVAVGDEGQETEALLEIDALDFGTYHFYPEQWDMRPSDGLAWIESHVAAGRRAGKPVVLEEYGLRDTAARNRWYGKWRRAAEPGGGSLVWMLGSPHPEVAGYSDEYTLFADDAL
jgi:mannan endo-1,4-beta-mannosidase